MIFLYRVWDTRSSVVEYCASRAPRMAWRKLSNLTAPVADGSGRALPHPPAPTALSYSGVQLWPVMAPSGWWGDRLGCPG